jgi:hypothetical protein
VSTTAWTQAALDAATEIASAAEGVSADGTIPQEVGRLLMSLGEAAGHADQLRLKGSVGRAGRKHFRQHMVRAGANAALLLRRSHQQKDVTVPELQQLTAAVVSRRVISTREEQQSQVRAAHPAARVGAAITALGQALASTPLDERHMPKLHDVMERVLAEAIAAVAFSPSSGPASGRLVDRCKR